MSQISKAIEKAKRQRHFSGKNINQEVGANLELDYTKTQKILVNKRLLAKNRVVTSLEDELILDSYRLLRTRILRRMQQNNWKSLGITSPSKGVGKTTTAINLSISIAMKQNQSVILVDTDLRNPSVHEFFGFNPSNGIVELLTNDIKAEKILINPGIDRFTILPGKNRIEASSELLSSPKMSRLCEQLKSRYSSRIVIYDLPPVLVGDDVVAFASNLDAVLIIVEEGETESDKLKRSIDLLEGVEIIGTVLNKSKETTQNNDYYY